jgi:hypothetical protein
MNYTRKAALGKYQNSFLCKNTLIFLHKNTNAKQKVKNFTTRQATESILSKDNSSQSLTLAGLSAPVSPGVH